eukprot:758452-Hanusia_phi.AAC.1
MRKSQEYQYPYPVGAIPVPWHCTSRCPPLPHIPPHYYNPHPSLCPHGPAMAAPNLWEVFGRKKYD